MPLAPNFDEERTLWRQGYHLVAGLDEVGRGPLAGPVAAAAVILSPDADFRWLYHVRDSKELAPSDRQELAAYIYADALAVGIGFVSHTTIDRIGIAEATRQAMLRAISEMRSRPDHLLIDAISIPACSLPQIGIIDGDARCITIAAASIVAKVARDRYMKRTARRFRGYGFARNKGYATRQHLEALRRLGPCDLHRRSFAPVRDMLATGAAV
ncbi:MAG: ribonuclease HII [Dehalococcoidia bacterium]